MGDKSTIQWTDATWNPVTGCSKVSPGCAHCYAERVAIRLWPSQYSPVADLRPVRFGDVRRPAGCCNSNACSELQCRCETPSAPVRPREFTDVQCHEDRLDQPLRWKKPRKIFVNSMSDLFHEDVPDAFIERVFSVMGLAERHVFQVLTKRPERMVAWFRARRFDVKGAAILQSERGSCVYSLPWPLPNVWLGVSVESPPFLKRLDELAATPAAIRFVSLEPLLADVGDVSRWLGGREARQRMTRAPLTQHGEATPGEDFRPATGNVAKSQLDPSGAVASSTLPSLDWVIVGGESGTGARPCDIAWARSIVAQCQAAGVPVFVKQLGANPRDGVKERPCSCRDLDCPHLGFEINQLRLRDSHGGDMAEWPEDLRVRQFPELSRA